MKSFYKHLKMSRGFILKAYLVIGVFMVISACFGILVKGFSYKFLYLPFAIFILIVCVNASKSRHWAKISLEIISWVFLSYGVVVGIYYLIPLLRQFLIQGLSTIDIMFISFASIVAFLPITLWVVIFVSVIKCLKKERYMESTDGSYE